MDIIYTSIVALFSLAFLAISLLLSLKSRRLTRQLAEHDQRVQVLQTELRAVTAGAVGMGQSIAKVEQLIRRLGDRQDQLVMSDPEGRSHAHAIKIARQGASVEEVINICGLVREEAELLVRLHRPSIHYSESEAN